MRLSKTRRLYESLTIILIVGMLGILSIIGVSLRANAQQVGNNKYFGVVTEVDMGQGMFALRSYQYWLDAAEWAGMIAEFKRRHTNLEVLSFSIMVDSHASRYNGVAIVTTPKNRCPQ